MADFRSAPNKGTDEKPYTTRYDKHELWAARMWRLFWGGWIMLGLSIIIFWFFTPSFKQLEDPTQNLASEVIAGDDTTVLGRFYIENRSPVAYSRLPKSLVDALVATEDKRFYNHSGIDPEAIGRVFARSLFLMQSGQGGGSTLSMQLAKLLYSDRNLKDRNFIYKTYLYYYYKLSEMITAAKLERAYSKQEIIAMYLNKYDFGYQAAGIRAASEVYFNKPPEKLALEESATFVAMCNNSSYYNPIRRNELTKSRRNLVLRRMAESAYITPKVAETTQKLPLDVSRFKTRTHNDGLATYFRMMLADEVKRLLKENGIVKPDGTAYDVYRDGLKIYTTIDPEMQRLAEEALREHMASLQAKYFKVWKGKDPWAYRDGDTNDEQIKQRQASLDTRVRESDRYLRMRGTYLDPIIEKIMSETGVSSVTDYDIMNMLREKIKPGSIEELIRKKILNDSRGDALRKIMSSSAFPQIEGAWNKLKNAVAAEFNRPVKMKVFAYNTTGEKDTTMTPMDSVRYHRMHLQLGSMAMDPENGYVKFWVGGINHKYFQYDHVRSERQVGSTIKPFVYSAAINDFGISPCDRVTDTPQTIGVGEGDFGLSAPWTPKNSGGYSGASFTLWEALKESKNTASVHLVKQMATTQPIRTIMREMGINTDATLPNGQLRVPRNPAICLGACDLTVYEMTSAYTTFANAGTRFKPLFVRRITDKAGKVLARFSSESNAPLSKTAAYAMQQMLRYNVRSAAGISSLKTPVGGKTGTTNDYHDGWFMAIAPKLVVGTWVGGEDNWIRFLSIADGQGSAMARPFFAKTMAKIEKSNRITYDANAKFKPFEGNLGITLDCGAYYQTAAANEASTGANVRTDSFQDEESGNNTNPPPPRPAPRPAPNQSTAPRPSRPSNQQ